MRIFLIGFMGSGKTTAGKKLARALGFDFFDLDEFIENLESMSISEIFNTKGEFYFRETERNCLLDMIHLEKSVIATGGGTPCFFDNIDWMNNYGITVYLQASPQLLLERIKDETENRPLLEEIEEPELLAYISDKLRERSVFYQKAQFTFNVGETTNLISDIKRTVSYLIGF